ncbi:glycosyltransferase family 4 protein [Polymorphospora rubra]|uniref:glycosyltransferase family 4 protein n=1 Tax=Polymorphospora rubra TaxID=338584 RepID=UPI0033CF023A
MALTVVSTYLPIPQDRGDPVRVLMMLRAIARIREYTLMVVEREDTTTADTDELRRLLPEVDVRVFPATPYRWNRLGPLGRYPEALVGGLPPWVRTRYSRPLHDELRDRSGPAVAIGEAAGAYFRDTKLRWHWDKANVLAASTLEDVNEAQDDAHRLRARYLAGISMRFEKQALSLCSTVSVTSAEEAERLRHHHGRTADFTLPSAVALPTGHLRRPENRSLIWLSSFSYRSNSLGLLRFLDEGWARLRQAGYTLTLVGSGLTGQLRADLEQHEGVRVLGYVEDLRPVLGAADAAVVPLWSGAGVKLKTLTLLAHAVPVFSTPVGAEGVPATAAVRVADTPAALAEAILDTPPSHLDAMAAEAVRLVHGQFSESRFGEHLVDSLAAHHYLSSGARPYEGP